MPTSREQLKFKAIHRTKRRIHPMRDDKGNYLRISDYYGQNVFDVRKASGIPDKVRKEITESARSGKHLSKENSEIIAKAVMEWALEKGATHFCHWFQPLTGSTAEKHDAMLSFTSDGKPIEKLSATALLQGEPDASSFPNGGSRSTFEARGYTSWDLTSPLFIVEGENGNTLCIPTAFVSYYGDALDIKTPLLRSISHLDKVATEFLHLIGHNKTTHVHVTAGPEQEYFLIDKAFYYARTDLVMGGRAVFGKRTSRNQQLEDHYFGTIPERVLAFMQELDIELHKLGISSKTRHNEVAPGQFEVAPIFCEANVAADQNMLMMSTLRKVAEKHDFVCLLHEKPFAGINGSGKHLNWSMSDNTGLNFLDPGSDPQTNYRFLAVVGIIIEALARHGDALRMAIASHGNDHRLGANEAPPSIISIYLGDTLNRIFESLDQGKTFTPSDKTFLDMGANQLAQLMLDNTDRNRTSPFAFTGNRFEFRAVGSSQAIGLPMSILNAAVAEVFQESNRLIEADLKAKKSVDEALINIARKWYGQSKKVVFNGDGYSQEWVDEAKRRGLPNFRTAPEALKVLTDPKAVAFLTESKVFTSNELDTRYNVMIERYIKCREIEYDTLNTMVTQQIIPCALKYKKVLATTIKAQKDVGADASVEQDILSQVSAQVKGAYHLVEELKKGLEGVHSKNPQAGAEYMSKELLDKANQLGEYCNHLEELVPEELWDIPKFYDMLFLR